MNNISVEVYRSNMSDCTLNGLTSRFNTLELYSDVKGSDIVLVPDDALVMVERTIQGERCDYAVPAYILKNGYTKMFGGNFVYTSDSRFPDIYRRPLPVHDRVER